MKSFPAKQNLSQWPLPALFLSLFFKIRTQVSEISTHAKHKLQSGLVDVFKHPDRWNSILGTSCLLFFFFLSIFPPSVSWRGLSKLKKTIFVAHILVTLVSKLIYTRLRLHARMHMHTVLCRAWSKINGAEMSLKVKRCLWICKWEAKNCSPLNWSTLSAFHPVICWFVKYSHMNGFAVPCGPL